MQMLPNEKYKNHPCSFVSVGCAYEDIYKKEFLSEVSNEVKDDGYLTLDAMNKYIRNNLNISKKIYFKRNERISLKEFLKNNNSKAIVCILGHFIYVNNKDYLSFFNNDEDLVVCIWIIK